MTSAVIWLLCWLTAVLASAELLDRDRPRLRQAVAATLFTGVVICGVALRGDRLGAIAAGLAATLILLSLDRLSGGTTSRSAEPTLDRLRSLATVCATGVFLALVIQQLMIRSRYAYGATWANTAEALTLGLLVATSWSDRRSRLRVAFCLGALTAFFLLARFSPPSAAWYRDGQFKLFAVAMASATAWLVGEYIVGRVPGVRGPSGHAEVVRHPKGPWTLLVLGGAFFVLMNFLSTRSVLLREVVAIDQESGAVNWQTTVSSQYGAPSLHITSSAAAPTAVTDGKLIFAYFGGAGVYALDLAGNVVWARHESAPPPHWGAGSSPILHRDRLIVTYDVDHESFTEALDTRTGERLWLADRTEQIVGQIDVPDGRHLTLDAYSTPMVFQWGGRTELITHAKSLLAAYEPATGRELWHMKSKGRQVIPSTIQWNDLLIVGGAESHKYLAAIRVDAEGVPEILWEAKRYQPDVPSPVIYDDLLYTVASSGIAACREPSTGEVLWRERLPGHYYSSLIAADGKIFFSSREGVVSVVEAGETFKLLSQNELGEGIHSTLAIADGDLFIRGDRHMYRISHANNEPDSQIAALSPPPRLPTKD